MTRTSSLRQGDSILSRAINILGMHRTGTSLTARILNVLGVDLGSKGGLLETKSAENPKGFWEQVAIKEFNDELLGTLGGLWDAPPDLEPGWEYDPGLSEYRERAQQLIVDYFGDAELWGWKDPRSAILLPFWQQIVPDLSYVVCLRHPQGVAESMIRRRNNISPAVAHELWLRYTTGALLHSRQGRRVMVFFEDFFEDLDRQVHHLAAFLDRDPMTIEPGAWSKIRALADPSLWRNRTSPDDDAGLPGEVRALWVGLRSAVAPTDQPASPAFSLRDTEASARAFVRASARRAEGRQALQNERAEQLRATEKQLRRSLRKVGEYEEKLRGARSKLRRAEKRLATTEAEVRASQVRLRAAERGLHAAGEASEKLKQMERSRSWKITRPLRGATALLARLRWRPRRKRSEQAAQAADEPAGSEGASRPAATNGAPAETTAVRSAGPGRNRHTSSGARGPDGDAAPGLRRLLVGSTFGRRALEVARHHHPDGLMRALGRAESDGASARVRLAEHGSLPLVTVIMPTHDRAGIIGDAIRTVIEQEYGSWELLICDDGSTDDTAAVVAGFAEPRLRYLGLPKQGAAAARNAGLREARGELIAYLDSDNYWHPAFLTTIVAALVESPGRSAVYTDYIDYHVTVAGTHTVKAIGGPSFDQERLLEKPYIDLSAFAHRRELYDCFGGFDERLTRRQDHDLLIKYTWLRDPLRIPSPLMLYQRNDALAQVTRLHRHDDSCIRIIDESVVAYQRDGLRVVGPPPVKKVTVLAWDLCRNHFAKPFAVAEALSADYDVQLISFRFFENQIFGPLQGVKPRFETLYLPGGDFPDFFESMARGVAAIRGDAVYVVKPRLPSLGVALLANEQTGVPILLEVNDLETVVGSPRASDEHRDAALETLDLSDELRSPYSDQWSQIMAPLAREVPTLLTHNRELDALLDNRCLYMRNVKDEAIYNPALYDRGSIRARLGFDPDDRVVLFGGMLRRHKGIYELIELLRRLGDPRFKLLFVGSRSTPDQRRLAEEHPEIRILAPQGREAMAEINLAADLVVLWLDPDIPASRYQMPYKATDALAMKTPIIANDISDLGELGRQGVLRLVPFADWDAMTRAVQEVFDDPDATETMCEAGRRLYLRQFSYAAARGNAALALTRAAAQQGRVLPVASRFAAQFAAFYEAFGHAPRHEGSAEPPGARATTMPPAG